MQAPDDVMIDVIRARWRAVAGDVVADHTQPERLEHGVLFVAVKNHVWLQELRRGMGRQIQEKLARQTDLPVRVIRWQLAAESDT